MAVSSSLSESVEALSLEKHTWCHYFLRSLYFILDSTVCLLLGAKWYPHFGFLYLSRSRVFWTEPQKFCVKHGSRSSIYQGIDLILIPIVLFSFQACVCNFFLLWRIWTKIRMNGVINRSKHEKDLGIILLIFPSLLDCYGSIPWGGSVGVWYLNPNVETYL